MRQPQTSTPYAWYSFSTRDVSTQNYVILLKTLKLNVPLPPRRKNITTVALDCTTPKWKFKTARWPLQNIAHLVRHSHASAPFSRDHPSWTDFAIAKRAESSAVVTRRAGVLNPSRSYQVTCDFRPKRSAITNLSRRVKGTAYPFG